MIPCRFCGKSSDSGECERPRCPGNASAIAILRDRIRSIDLNGFQTLTGDETIKELQATVAALQEDGIGAVKDWHSPRNNECAHNDDAEKDCTCKRIVKRKPFRQVRVEDPTASHGVRKHIIAEIHPNGRLVLRESGRRLRVETTLAVVYENGLARIGRAEALKLKQERAARRREKLLGKQMVKKLGART